MLIIQDYIPVTKAKASFLDIIRKIEGSEDAFAITKNGVPAAVLLSMKKFGMKFTPETSRVLSKFHPENKKIIKQALQELRRNPSAGTDLQEELYGFKSFKLKRYCVLYRINEEEKVIQVFTSVTEKMYMNNSTAC